MDIGTGDGGSATAVGTMHQNRGEGDGGAAHQTTGHTTPIRVHPGLVSIPIIAARPSVHHQRHSDGGDRTTIRRSKSSRDGLGEPPALAPAIWSGKQGVADDGSGLCGVAREWLTPLFRIPCADEWLADRNG